MYIDITYVLKISFDFKTKQKQKYYEDHKADCLEKVECKDCKKFISKIDLKKSLFTNVKAYQQVNYPQMLRESLWIFVDICGYLWI